MRVMLMAHGPNGVTDASSWSGEVDWPGVPPTGSCIRIPHSGTGGDVLTVHRVIYESDGTVYLILEQVDEDLRQKLREHGWTNWGG